MLQIVTTCGDGCPASCDPRPTEGAPAEQISSSEAAQFHRDSRAYPAFNPPAMMRASLGLVLVLIGGCAFEPGEYPGGDNGGGSGSGSGSGTVDPTADTDGDGMLDAT